jgi:UDP-N-acetylmuramoyl-tripeptide--D-alanyl-D-alanine ligase
VNISNQGAAGIKFSVKEKNELDFPELSLPVPGEYNVYNALAAAAVGLDLGVSSNEIKQGLASFELSKYRKQLLTTSQGVKIINDAYNANPTSMEGALHTLVDVAKERSIAVLGDMLELGEIAGEEHRKIGELVVAEEIDYLFTIGELAQKIANRAQEVGKEESKIFSYQDTKLAIDDLQELVKPKDTVLVKASRGMKLEEIVAALQDKE